VYFLVIEVPLKALCRHCLGEGAYMPAVFVLIKVSLISVQVTLQEGSDPPCKDHRGALGVSLQGYLDHKKPPSPLGAPQGPRHRPAVGS